MGGVPFVSASVPLKQNNFQGLRVYALSQGTYTGTLLVQLKSPGV